MRCRAPLLLLLATAALAGEPPSSGALDDAPPPATPSTVKFSAAGTKDAPVDGKDGRPHEGPFVEIENLRQSAAKADKDPLPPLKDRPFDPTVIDGKRIPETNDGVMDDKNRPEPKVGTTGTAGGVSEKDKARKEQEGRTGEKVENRPETPQGGPAAAAQRAGEAAAQPAGRPLARQGQARQPRGRGRLRGAWRASSLSLPLVVAALPLPA